MVRIIVEYVPKIDKKRGEGVKEINYKLEEK